MSGSNTTTTAVLGASTTAVGAIVLPNTHGNNLLTIVSLAAVGLGVLTILSFITSRLATKFLR